MLDEAHPPMILRERKFMQAAPVEIQLATSSTNIYSYTICVYRVMLCVCSNSWDEEVMQMNEEDREWLTGNSVVVHVQEPLWEEAP